MKLDPKLRTIIVTEAALYNLPPDVIYGIVCTESEGKLKATRYEPAFYDRYIPERVKHESPEEAKNQATSWGLMQVMGSNLRDMGFVEPFEVILSDPTKAIDYGCRFFKGLYKKYFEKWGINGVIAAYNSGSPILKKDGTFRNQAYVNKVNKNRRDF